MKHNPKIIAAGTVLLLTTVLSHATPAADNWTNHCAKCHGADGKGETKVGKKLNLKDYTDAAVQAKMTDAEMTKAITDGVLINGKQKMKAFKDDLSADEIKDLVAHIRRFKS